MQNELMKFRGLQPDNKMESRQFLHHWNLLTKDARDNKLDPYIYKYAVQPPRKSG